MTTPYERQQAMVAVARFLEDMCQPKKTSGVPLAVRTRAFALLKHYPSYEHLMRMKFCLMCGLDMTTHQELRDPKSTNCIFCTPKEQP